MTAVLGKNESLEEASFLSVEALNKDNILDFFKYEFRAGKF